MKLKQSGLVAVIASLSLLTVACEKAGPVGVFDERSDVGDVGTPGKVSFDEATGTYELTASGANIWDRRDAFFYVYKEMEGDFHFEADVNLLGEGLDPFRKAGLMIRSGLAPNAAYADIMVHGNGLTALQYRPEENVDTTHIVPHMTSATRMRLEREGDYVYMALAQNAGEPFKRVGGNVRIKIEAPVYVGLVVSSHNNDVTESASFSNVTLTSVDVTLPEDTHNAVVDSTLEIIEIENTNRHVVHHVEGTKFSSPNWTPNGAHLIFNQGGLLYKLPIDGGEPQQINTGPLTHNENDHGISPDGTQLIISDTSESAEQNISSIYVMPITGSDAPTPVVVDTEVQAFWHSWSPDGSTIAFTGQDPATNNYNVWLKRLDGGEPWKLTNTDGVDDGPDYSPDGKWIYHNSSRSGQMKIWRISPEGGDPEQITFGEDSRDWFPHPSPNGKWIAYLAYPASDDITGLGTNKDVELRIVPTDGSAEPRTIASFLGGHGTINAPSWAPDSRRLAFVSYRYAKDQSTE